MSNKQDVVFNFEESLASLEKLVAAMEEGELSLEESLQAFEQGIRLTRECQEALQKAEQKVQVLVDENSAPITADLAADGDGSLL